MGVRGELFSTKVALQNRTYFFNVKENRLGDLYLNIVESKNRDEGGFERQSVILFAEDLQEFLGGFDESLHVLEKAFREKRRGKGNSSGGWENKRDSDRDGAGSYSRESQSRRDDRDFRKSEGPRRPRDAGPGRKSGGSGRSFSGQEHRRSRYTKDDRDSQPANYRSSEKRDYAPRKKRVIVKKS